MVELKYDEGKVVIVKHKWMLKQKKIYNKTDDEFCYWSNNLEDSLEDMKCEYSPKFTGEPALFKVFVIKLTGIYSLISSLSTSYCKNARRDNDEK